MTKLTRRHLFSTVAGLGAAAAFCPINAAQASAPPAGKQNAGFYRYKVGDIEVTVVTDGANTFKFADNHLTNKTRDDLNKALETAFYPKDLMTTPYNPIVVNTRASSIVIDTGTGEAAYERSKGVTGQFQTNLKAAGIDRNAVDTVIISHFHGDHINGLITPDKKLAYPNAEILVPAGDWKFFMDDGEMSRADQRPHEGGVQGRARRVRCDQPQGHALRARQGSRARASPRSRLRATRPGTARTSSRPATTRSSCRATSRTCRG